MPNIREGESARRLSIRLRLLTELFGLSSTLYLEIAYSLKAKVYVWLEYFLFYKMSINKMLLQFF